MGWSGRVWGTRKPNRGYGSSRRRSGGQGGGGRRGRSIKSGRVDATKRKSRRGMRRRLVIGGRRSRSRMRGGWGRRGRRGPRRDVVGLRVGPELGPERGNIPSHLRHHGAHCIELLRRAVRFARSAMIVGHVARRSEATGAAKVVRTECGARSGAGSLAAVRRRRRGAVVSPRRRRRLRVLARCVSRWLLERAKYREAHG